MSIYLALSLTVAIRLLIAMTMVTVSVPTGYWSRDRDGPGLGAGTQGVGDGHTAHLAAVGAEPAQQQVGLGGHVGGGQQGTDLHVVRRVPGEQVSTRAHSSPPRPGWRSSIAPAISQRLLVTRQ